jgi:hypothetical protein
MKFAEYWDNYKPKEIILMANDRKVAGLPKIDRMGA